MPHQTTAAVRPQSTATTYEGKGLDQPLPLVATLRWVGEAARFYADALILQHGGFKPH